MQASRRARNSGRTSQYYARAAMADRRSVELQPFEAERLSMQAGRNGNRSKFPDSGPVEHRPPANHAKAENSPNAALSPGLSADGRESVAGRCVQTPFIGNGLRRP